MARRPEPWPAPEEPRLPPLRLELASETVEFIVAEVTRRVLLELDGREERRALPFLTFEEAAAVARVSPRTIRRWVEAGKLARCGSTARPLVERSDLEWLLREGQAEP